MEIFWGDEDQRFITIPDGDVATHKQIKDYYENKYGIKVEIQWK